MILASAAYNRLHYLPPRLVVADFLAKRVAEAENRVTLSDFEDIPEDVCNRCKELSNEKAN